MTEFVDSVIERLEFESCCDISLDTPTSELGSANTIIVKRDIDHPELDCKAVAALIDKAVLDKITKVSGKGTKVRVPWTDVENTSIMNDIYNAKNVKNSKSIMIYYPLRIFGTIRNPTEYLVIDTDSPKAPASIPDEIRFSGTKLLNPTNTAFVISSGLVEVKLGNFTIDKDKISVKIAIETDKDFKIDKLTGVFKSE